MNRHSRFSKMELAFHTENIMFVLRNTIYLCMYIRLYIHRVVALYSLIAHICDVYDYFHNGINIDEQANKSHHMANYVAASLSLAYSVYFLANI